MFPSSSDFVIAAIALLLIGALLGIGCSAGCGYVRKHVEVEWKP